MPGRDFRKYGLLEPNATNVHLVTYIERLMFFLVFPRENKTEIPNFQIKNTHKICTDRKQNNTFSKTDFQKTFINTTDTPLKSVDNAKGDWYRQ